ncbi:chromosome segregation ATPase [Rhodoferax ferrireducens]|uniref:Chromosome segregation ATPase n=1 Tax=Rhodoferax ferrireducens TaxID=192843 RepID=A0ABU2C6X5_9BURK|nr:DNA-binding protein [Rhodoferax ferrireducens]MDR7377094.1 chromosome segregation ATPase [Rhodoferax ferrireducens]
MQQDDVWTAADALLAEGLRPTIERVRLKMGRGSPNTVGPLLETWFATLGPRLGVGEAKEEAGGLPAAVQQASIKLWEAALSQARKEVNIAAAAARQVLTDERAIFESRVAELAQQEAVFAERQAAAERALLVAQEQMADLAARLREAQTVLAERGQDIEALQSKLSAVEQQRDTERRRTEEERQRHAEERIRIDERTAANERRLMQDLDRERQEAKLAKAAVAAATQRAEAASQQSELDKRQLGEKLRQTDAELRSSRQALASTQERAAELRALLDAQAAASAATLKQLDVLLAHQTLPASVNAPEQVRIPKRAPKRSAETAQK